MLTKWHLILSWKTRVLHFVSKPGTLDYVFTFNNRINHKNKSKRYNMKISIINNKSIVIDDHYIVRKV